VLEELRRFQRRVERSAEDEGNNWGVRYVILASLVPRVFNFGGDLDLFIRCVKENDPETLRRYAKECIDVLYAHAIGFQLPITTISLVQGDALGGGFEAALASDIIVSEKQSQFGFPEVLFNLFPGMGAYNLLSRRIGTQRTEQMLTNGKMYRAEDLHKEGVIDVLTESGRGENAVYEFIVRNENRRNAREGVHRVRRRLFPLRYEELLDVGDIWVDTAMRVGAREIRMMERLARSQGKVAQRDPIFLVPSAGRDH
jgi:DSF synthase